MTTRIIAPYGSWKSPITSDLIVAGTVGLSQVRLDGDDLYWVEARPREAGRNALVRQARDGRIEDVTPPPYNVRTRAHEYGGGAYCVSRGTVFFANHADQRLYVQPPGGSPSPLTAAEKVRFADLEPDPDRRRLLAVQEDHRAGGEPVNTLVAIDTADGTIRELAGGHDFYSSPRLSPDGTRLAWLAWNHPNMPWDGTELWLADVDHAGAPFNARRVAGGPQESVFQPEWSPDGVLYFVSDPTGWWNLYRCTGGRAEPVCPMEAEFGRPQWVFGMAAYAFASPREIVCSYVQNGLASLATLDTASKAWRPLATPFIDVRPDVRAAGGSAVFVAGAADQPVSLVRLDLASGRREVVRRSSESAVDAGYLSPAQAIEFPTEGGLTAHAFYYPPHNRDYEGLRSELPPLLVKSHGGPTGSASPALRLETQYWTSRGFAVLDVNYGGSTGFGRAYRERLRGRWGVVDVDDCVNGARHLAALGLVDGERLAISGGSAGGYTTLCALTFRDVFKAGASHYGVSDLEALARDTHKFESRYLDGLVGPYPAERETYRARSPINHVERLSCPVIFFQGTEDEVVPPNQTERMAAALRRKGIPVAMLLFEGEQHGFRRAENIKRALDAELYFYSRVFGFGLADLTDPVPIDNL